MNNENFKFEIGQKVIYEGLIGIIESRAIYPSGIAHYGLVAELDSEMTCTAAEGECELLDNQEIDQSEAMSEAKASSNRIMGMVDSITDKYIGDCSF